MRKKKNSRRGIPQLNVEINPDLLRRVRIEAIERELSIKQLVELALSEYFGIAPQSFDREQE